jgi:hypothetical protein
LVGIRKKFSGLFFLVKTINLSHQKENKNMRNIEMKIEKKQIKIKHVLIVY